MITYSVKVISTFGRTQTFTLKAGSAEAARRWAVGEAEEKWHVTFNQLTAEVTEA